jgi:CIC family chloride channel protein
LILFEFKARSFIPLVIASTIATSVHLVLMGRGPMFQVGTIDFGVPRVLPWYLLLGAICGLAAVGFSNLLYWVEDQFEKLPIDWMWWPAIGCVILGVVGYFVPRVLGVGYDTISDILNVHLVFSVLLLVMLCKALVLVVTIGSGTSGGLLAPMFMSSAAMGSLVAMIINHYVPSAAISPAAFALVAMGAVFGAASRATFTFIIFAFEITQDYNSILPLMLVAVIADGIAMAFSPNSIMTEKLARRGLKIHADYEPDILRQITVGEAMSKEIVQLPGTTPVREMAERLAKHDPVLSKHQGVLVVDETGKLQGIITRGDILRAMETDPMGNITVLEAGSRKLQVTYTDELLYHAANRMIAADVGRLPVVDRHDTTKVVGYLGRSGILSARLRQIQEEQVLEEGWMGARRRLRRSQRTPTHAD